MPGEYYMRGYLPLSTMLFLATPAMAEPLTFDQALARANRDAPSIAGRAAQSDAARSGAIAADRLPDPKLEIRLTDFPVTGPNAGTINRDDFTERDIGFSQEIPNLAKRHARAGRAQADIVAADAETIAERRRVRIAAALAWIDLFYAERRLAILNGLEQRIAELAATAPARLASGKIRPAEAIEPAKLKAELDDRRSDLQAALAAARAGLTRWTSEANPEISGDLPIFTVDDARLRASIALLPSLRIKDAAIGQASANVQLAQADKRPDWEITATFGSRAPRFGDFASLGVKIDLPFFAKKRQDPIIAARASERDRARLERADAEREAVAQLEGDLAGHEAHHNRFVRAQTTLLPLARQRAELDRASYAAGRIDLGTTQQSAIALAEAEIDLLDREADVVRDGARITLTYEGDRP